jgi:hypothetical protein
MLKANAMIIFSCENGFNLNPKRRFFAKLVGKNHNIAPCIPSTDVSFKTSPFFARKDCRR